MKMALVSSMDTEPSAPCGTADGCGGVKCADHFSHADIHCCSLIGTSLSISNNTITLFRREFSLNIRRMTVFGTYSSKLYTV